MRRVLLLAVALGIGLAAGEYLTRNFTFRRWLGEVVRRGQLEALVGTRGIYDRDRERSGRSLESLINEAKLDAAAAAQPIRSSQIARGMDLLRWQFGAAHRWSLLEEFLLRRELAANLRDRAWLEARLAARIAPNDEEIRSFYNAHPALFQEPLRFRASHLFLAAPNSYPDEVIAAKRSLIDALDVRLKKGESFPALVAEFSEDEATKKRAGDLGYFARERILPAVFNAARSLGEGQTSGPLRSRLGFHLLQLTRTLPAAPLGFEQVAPEIRLTLENAKRAAAGPEIVAQLGGKIEIAAHRD